MFIKKFESFFDAGESKRVNLYEFKQFIRGREKIFLDEDELDSIKSKILDNGLRCTSYKKNKSKHTTWIDCPGMLPFQVLKLEDEWYGISFDYGGINTATYLCDGFESLLDIIDKEIKELHRIGWSKLSGRRND